jgi:hypothetical protein
LKVVDRFCICPLLKSRSSISIKYMVKQKKQKDRDGVLESRKENHDLDDI